MAHLVHPPLRRRLKSALLVFGFALFVIMAVLTAHQASDPRLSRGRHVAVRPSVVSTVPVVAASTGAAASGLVRDAESTSVEPPTPSPTPVATLQSPTTALQPTAQAEARSAALNRARALSASLRAAAAEQRSAAAEAHHN